MNASENLFPSIHADEVDMARRFGGIGRLYGAGALERFQNAHVCVIGVGGVGSWIVEALARSAIGQLTLIDLDNVSESNINRQIMAMTGTIGMPKIDALADRIVQINPSCKLNLVEDFIGPENVEAMLGGRGFDYVIDAIDSVKAKAAVIAWCRDHAMPLVTIGSAGGQLDPTKIALRDLARTEQEPLLKMVRKKLRNQYGFPRGEKHKFHIDAVFSMEPLSLPEGDGSCSIDGSLNCAGFGSSMVVTATFGMFAAGHALRQLAAGARAQAAAIPPDAPEAVQAAEAALS
jgi:tRNA A37 threonylcarbamoyladenosine dehydratase